MPNQRFWFVRAGRQAWDVDEFLSGGLVAIGWREVGPIEKGTSDAALERIFRERYPDEREGSRRAWMAQVRRFVEEIEVGDPVMTYDPERRTYYLGRIESPAEWRDHDLPRVRRVQWTAQVFRDGLTARTRNALGSIATLFLASAEASEELRERAVPVGGEQPAAPPRTPDRAGEAEAGEGEEELGDETFRKAEQFIEDRISRLDWRELQDLVAGILRAMGYKTRVSAEGPDRGHDIFASPDGLGLQEPRIFVEVKHRAETVGAPQIRAFLGGRKPGDRCLYVSTGSFSKDAKYEANRSSVPLELVTLPQLRELLLEHYESLDAAARALVPLRKIYWPVG